MLPVCVCVVWWRCVCVFVWGGGSMACCVFVYRRLQSVKAAFSSSAPLQTVYGGIPLRLSVARTMPSLGRRPNGFWTQWLTLHVTMRVGKKKCLSDWQVAFVAIICKLVLVHACAPRPHTFLIGENIRSAHVCKDQWSWPEGSHLNSSRRGFGFTFFSLIV